MPRRALLLALSGAAAAGLLAGCASAPDANGPLHIDLRTLPDLVTAEISNVGDAPVEIVDYEDAVQGAPEQLLIRYRLADDSGPSRDAEYWWTPALLVSTARPGSGPRTVLAPGQTMVLSAKPRDLMLGMARPPLIEGVEYQIRVVVEGGAAPTLLAQRTSDWTALN